MVPRNHDRRSNDRTEIRTVRGESESTLLAILRAVATAKNVPVTELDRLYDRIDFEPPVDLLTCTKDSDVIVSIEFTIEGYTVVVSNNDTAYVHDGNPVLARIHGETQL